MTAEQSRRIDGGGVSEAGRFAWREAGRRALFWSIAILSAAILGLFCVTLMAPRVSETLQPGSIQSDGDDAYVQGLSLQAPWPYVVPSHPEFGLSPGDATLSEDGKPIGKLEPSHAEIRRLGGGRFDFWQGTLWFSTSGLDPRDPAHTYRFSVGTRMNADLSRIWYWCGVALLGLVAVQVGRRAVSVGRGITWSETWVWRRLRWRFLLPFLVATLGLLVGFAALASRFPFRVVFFSDSYAYIEPGLRLADGQSIVGASVRGLGYPFLTFVAIRLGSITDLAPIQLGLVLLGMGCLLVVMAIFGRAMLRAAGFAAGRVPVLLTAGLIAVGLLDELLLFSHNGFMLDVYSMMAEAPHLLPMAVALLYLVGGWTARSGRSRIVLMALATVASFVSALVKPSSLIAFALCAACLLAACVLHRRLLRSAAVLGTLALTVAIVGGLHRLDTWVTPPYDDFSARVLFCNHLDVMDAHIEPTTPERAAIKRLIAHVFSLGPDSWPLQGYNGDECSFRQEFTEAIEAAARSEGRTPKDWQTHEFIAAVVTHPLRYSKHVAKQLTHFALDPIQEADEETAGFISDPDWSRLSAFGGIRTEHQRTFMGSLAPWFRDFAPDLVSTLKTVLRFVSSTFAFVAGASTLLALRAVFRLRSPDRLEPEIILLSIGAFTTALPMTVALSHSFDVGRYSVDIMPFTVLWWCVGLIYLLRGASRIGAKL